MISFKFVSSFLFLLLCNSIVAQSHLNIEKLQQKVDSMFLDIETGINPGSAILVIKDENIILNKGYGFANLEYEIAITSNTIFDLASLAKQFTGYAISLLIEQGKISKNDDIKKYLPEFPVFEQKITIGNLLHHTSGLRDWTSTFPLAGKSFNDMISYDQIIRMVQEQQKLNFVPGSQYAYSNTGYNLLVEIIERITSTSYREWTHQNIFLPLQMPNTFFLDNHNEVIKNRATGYYKDENGHYNYAPNSLTALGSSSLYSTTTDLSRWVTHLMHPKEEWKPVIERMFQTDTLNNGDDNNYASGIAVTKFRDTKLITHSGSWASFRTYIALFPSYDLSIVVLNNNEQSASRIAHKIASLYISDSVENNDDDNEVAESAARNIPEEILNQYIGTYKLGIAWYVHLSKEGGQLWTQATEEDKYPMTALSDTVFLVKDYGNRTMAFYKNDKGEVTHLVYNGEQCPKVSNEITFKSKDLIQYTGEYFSEELYTFYKVILKDETLMLWNIFNGEIHLTPVWDNAFLSSQWYAGNLEFMRDDTGQIIGLHISNQRARNQFFKKRDIIDND